MDPFTLFVLAVVGYAGYGVATQPTPRFLGDRAVKGDVVLIGRSTPGLPDAIPQGPPGSASVAVRVDTVDKDAVRGPVVGYTVTGAPGVQPMAATSPIQVPRNLVTGVIRSGTPLRGSQV